VLVFVYVAVDVVSKLDAGYSNFTIDLARFIKRGLPAAALFRKLPAISKSSGV